MANESPISILQALNAWKKEYTKRIISKLHPSGDVLQVGFNNTFAADDIQAFNPKSHTIIEPNPGKAEQAKIWAGSHANVKVIAGNWQQTLPQLKAFHAIYFEETTPLSENDFKIPSKFEDLHASSEKAIEALSTLEKQIQQIKAKYSDEEVEKMLQQLGISFKGLLPLGLKPKPKRGTVPPKTSDTRLQAVAPTLVSDPFLLFVLQCLESHATQGTKISGFVELPISKYEDSRFFEQVITNARLNFLEEIAEIAVEGVSRKGLVLLIEVIEGTEGTKATKGTEAT